MAAVIAVGCSLQATPFATSTASVSPTVSATMLSKGCGSTSVLLGGAPNWMRLLEGSSTYTDAVPYALSSPPTAAAVIFGYPLRAGHPQNPANKILWLVSLSPRAGSLDLSVRLVGTTVPNISQSVKFLASGDLPSIVDVPRPGCWQFDLSWSGHRTAIELQYQ